MINFAVIGEAAGRDSVTWAVDFSEAKDLDSEFVELSELIKAHREDYTFRLMLEAVEHDQSKDFLRAYDERWPANVNAIASALKMLWKLANEYEFDAVRAVGAIHCLNTRGFSSRDVAAFMSHIYDDEDAGTPHVYEGDEGMEDAAVEFLGQERVDRLNSRGALKAAMMNMPFVTVCTYDNEVFTAVENTTYASITSSYNPR